MPFSVDTLRKEIDRLNERLIEYQKVIMSQTGQITKFNELSPILTKFVNYDLNASEAREFIAVALGIKKTADTVKPFHVCWNCDALAVKYNGLIADRDVIINRQNQKIIDQRNAIDYSDNLLSARNKRIEQLEKQLAERVLKGTVKIDGDLYKLIPPDMEDE